MLVETGGSAVPSDPSTNPQQRVWDRDIIKTVYNQLLDAAPDDYLRARLLVVASPHAGG